MEFDENKHPRDDEGKFTSGNGGNSSSGESEKRAYKEAFLKSKGYLTSQLKDFTDEEINKRVEKHGGINGTEVKKIENIKMKIQEMIDKYKIAITTVKGEKALQLSGVGINQNEIDFIRTHKPEIISTILADEAAAKAESEARKSKIASIEGLTELQDAIASWDEYHAERNRRFDNEQLSSFGIKAPTQSVSDLKSKYPRAAAYLKALSYSDASNFEKSAAGSRALKRIINGDDFNVVIKDMEAEWSTATKNKMWD